MRVSFLSPVRPVLAGLLVLTLLGAGAGCASKGDTSASADDTEAVSDDAGSGAATAATTDYEGRHRSDPRLVAARAELDAAVRQGVAELTAAGWGFPEGRGPVVRLSDDVGRAEGVRVRVALHEGRRRPILHVSPRALMAGEVGPGRRLRIALAEAALVARAGDRTLPEDVLAGAPLVLADAVLDTAIVSVLESKQPSLDAADVYSGPTGRRLAAAVRMGAVERIGLGERPLERYLDALLDGADPLAALAEVGVDDSTFLEAAGETDRDRLLTDLVLEPLLAEVVDLRRALFAGGPAAADPMVATVLDGLKEGADARVATDARLAVAEVHAAGGDLVRAHSRLREVLKERSSLIRHQDARRLELVLAEGGARHAELAVRFLEDYPDDPAGQEALDALGFGPEVSAPVRALSVAVLSPQADERARAAGALARLRTDDAVEVLHRLSRDASPEVRAAVYEGYSVARPSDAAERLEDALDDPAPEARLAALEALLRVDPARGEEAARELAGVPDPVEPKPGDVVPSKPLPVKPSPPDAKETRRVPDAVRPKPVVPVRPDATPPKPVSPTPVTPPKPVPPKPVTPDPVTPPKPVTPPRSDDASRRRPTPPKPPTPPRRRTEPPTPPRPVPPRPVPESDDEPEKEKRSGPVPPPRPPKPLPKPTR